MFIDMRSKLTVMNQALSASGQPGKEITEASNDPEFALMERHYNEIVAEAFEAGVFHFGKVRYAATTRSAGDFGFDDAWLLPEDVLHITQVFVNERDIEDWERNGQYLYIDATEKVVVEYIGTNKESTWSPSFTKGIVGRLEALLRRSINEEFEEAANTDQAASFQLQMAGTQSSKQRGPRRAFRKGFLMRSRTHGSQRFRRRGEK